MNEQRNEQQQQAASSNGGSVPQTPNCISHVQHQQRPSSSHASSFGSAQQITMCLVREVKFDLEQNKNFHEFARKIKFIPMNILGESSEFGSNWMDAWAINNFVLNQELWINIFFLSIHRLKPSSQISQVSKSSNYLKRLKGCLQNEQNFFLFIFYFFIHHCRC